MNSGKTAAAAVYKELYREGAGILARVLEEEREAQLDARLLLEHVCGTGLQTLLLDGERPVSAEQAGLYREYVLRRSRREPLAYILGEREFMGLTFEVNADVLIPEQDTENLIEEIMRELHDSDRILDLCTGSGCILLSLLHYSNGTSGVGTDLSGKALAVAGRNAERLGLADRTELRCGDLFEPLSPDERFDIIVSNPPYIKSGVIEELAPEVRGHEPRMALDGGEDGLKFYKGIIKYWRSVLKPGGLIFFEVGEGEAEPVRAMLLEGGFAEAEFRQDSGGTDRVVIGRLEE